MGVQPIEVLAHFGENFTNTTRTAGIPGMPFWMLDGVANAEATAWWSGKANLVRLHCEDDRTIDLTPDRLVSVKTSPDGLAQWIEAENCENAWAMCFTSPKLMFQWSKIIKVEHLIEVDDVFDFRCVSTDAGVVNGFYCNGG